MKTSIYKWLILTGITVAFSFAVAAPQPAPKQTEAIYQKIQYCVQTATCELSDSTRYPHRFKQSEQDQFDEFNSIRDIAVLRSEIVITDPMRTGDPVHQQYKTKYPMLFEFDGRPGEVIANKAKFANKSLAECKKDLAKLEKVVGYCKIADF